MMPSRCELLSVLLVVMVVIGLTPRAGAQGKTQEGTAEEIEAHILSVRDDFATIDAGAGRGLRQGLEGLVTYELRLRDGTRQRVEAGRARVVAVRRDEADVRVNATKAEIKAGFRVAFRLPSIALPPRPAPPQDSTPEVPSVTPPPPLEPAPHSPTPDMASVTPPSMAAPAPQAPTLDEAPRSGVAGPTAPVRCLGHVFVSTMPPGASIAVDGRRMDRTTSTVLQRLECGRRHIVLALDGYEEVAREVTVDDDSVTELTVALPPRRSTLLLGSEPPGAAVWLQGEPRGVTPVRLDGVPSGQWRVRLEKVGYLTVEDTLQVTGPTERTFALVPCRGRVAVTSTPPGARVAVADGASTTTASTLEGLPCGLHELTFTLPGHQEVRRPVLVAHGATESVAAILAPLSSPLRLTVTPPDATLHFGGQVYGPGPVLLDVAWGRHPMRIEKSGFRPIDTVITVDRPGLIEHTFTLEALPPVIPPAASVRLTTFGYEGVGGAQGVLTLGLLTSFYAIELDGQRVIDWRILSTETTIEVPPGEHRLRVLMKTFLGQAPQVLDDRRLVFAAGSTNDVQVNFLLTRTTVNGEKAEFTRARRAP